MSAWREDWKKGLEDAKDALNEIEKEEKKMTAKEALEFLLKDLKHRHLVRKDGDENTQRDYIKIVEAALNRFEELEKVLKIIKKMFYYDKEFDLIEEKDNYKVSSSEFNLLKEYLK